jgi:hypothetical protein
MAALRCPFGWILPRCFVCSLLEVVRESGRDNQTSKQKGCFNDPALEHCFFSEVARFASLSSVIFFCLLRVVRIYFRLPRTSTFALGRRLLALPHLVARAILVER